MLELAHIYLKSRRRGGRRDAAPQVDGCVREIIRVCEKEGLKEGRERGEVQKQSRASKKSGAPQVDGAVMGV